MVRAVQIDVHSSLEKFTLQSSFGYKLVCTGTSPHLSPGTTSYSWCTWTSRFFPNQRFINFTQVGRRNRWYKDNVDRNVVSDEALTSVTSSSLLKLKLVTDQINDDHNDAEENNPWKSSNYALFLLMKRTMYNTKLKLFCELTSQIK